MLAKLGCKYVTVGHSERREYHLESDELVNKKVKAALKHGITPILCVGEKLEVREAGAHIEHATDQLVAGLKGLKPEQVRTVVVAYEPIWAIGTGRVATPADAEEACAALRAVLAEKCGAEVAADVRVLYGGSAKANNVSELVACDNVDGALVGGASLDGDEFTKLCALAAGGPLP
jgi:triosephosphate isomerase